PVRDDRRPRRHAPVRPSPKREASFARDLPPLRFLFDGGQSIATRSGQWCFVLKSDTLEAPQKLALHYAGIHRQEDRDARAAEAKKQFWHMIRVRVPLGMLSAGQ